MGTNMNILMKFPTLLHLPLLILADSDPQSAHSHASVSIGGVSFSHQNEHHGPPPIKPILPNVHLLKPVAPVAFAPVQVLQPKCTTIYEDECISAYEQQC